ncbi:MAG: hypothetical protein R3B45_16070 [Bdellovibrionota bacterium]
MITLVPEIIDGAVVCSLIEACDSSSGSECDICHEQTVYLHNWLVETELKYLVIDLQEEKAICSPFIEALLHLRKRLRFPFLFAGVIEKPKQILMRYDYTEFPFFISPEDAVRALRMAYPSITEVSLEHIKMGEPIGGIRPADEPEDEEDSDDD